MKTVTVLIGNSDDHLTQAEWREFYWDVDNDIDVYSLATHFTGSPPNFSMWQNAAWVIDIKDEEIIPLRERLAETCRTYKQNSIALVVGDVEFVYPNNGNVS